MSALLSIASSGLALGGVVVAAASLERVRRYRLRYEAELSQARLACRTDLLTGLPNRLALDEELAARSTGPKDWSLTLLDLDRFKHVNDTFGHDAGDRLLAEVAARLACGAGEHGLAARIAGDEFALVLPYAAEVAVLLVERVAELVSCPVDVVPGVSYRPSMSAGIVAGDPAVEAAELKRRADLALYQAKRQRGRVAVWTGTPSAHGCGVGRRQVRAELAAVPALTTAEVA
jgi:diguanylate cyclase (GGDEF)-like protein